MMQNGTKYADKDEGELNLESVAYELKNLVNARIEIEHDVLKPAVFAKKFAEGDEQKDLKQAEELIKILLNRGD